jgi:hypothetical protein
MNMRKKLLWLSVLLIAAVLVTSVLSVFVLSGHNCSGDRDTECAFCAVCEAFCEIRIIVGGSNLCCMLIPFFLLVLYVRNLANVLKPTLVRLKVKLSD